MKGYFAGSGWWKIIKGIRIVRANDGGWCLACIAGGKIEEVIWSVNGGVRDVIFYIDARDIISCLSERRNNKK